MGKRIGTCIGRGTAIAVLVLLIGHVVVWAQATPRVAVLTFRVAPVEPWWGTYDIGDGIAGLFARELKKYPEVAVREYMPCDGKTGSGISLCDTASRSVAGAGKELGADLVITGTVTAFHITSQDLPGLDQTQGKAVKIRQARVAIDARVVDVVTGATIAVLQAHAEDSGTEPIPATISEETWTVETFVNSPLGRATHRAVQKLAEQFIAETTRQ